MPLDETLGGAEKTARHEQALNRYDIVAQHITSFPRLLQSLIMASTTSTEIADDKYHCELTSLQNLRKESPWMKDPKFLKKVALSPSATMKMLMHCQSGVEKGISKGGM